MDIIFLQIESRIFPGATDTTATENFAVHDNLAHSESHKWILSSITTTNNQSLEINHQPSTINHQPSTINHQPSTINHQHFTNNQAGKNHGMQLGCQLSHAGWYLIGWWGRIWSEIFMTKYQTIAALLISFATIGDTNSTALTVSPEVFLQVSVCPNKSALPCALNKPP